MYDTCFGVLLIIVIDVKSHFIWEKEREKQSVDKAMPKMTKQFLPLLLWHL